MKNSIELEKQIVPYTLKVSTRARSMKLSVFRGGHLVVTIPRKFDWRIVEGFMLKKARWILRKIAYYSQFKDSLISRPLIREQYENYKDAALHLAKERLEFFNHHYRHSYSKVRIGRPSTRWGSCSRNRNLAFNYKIVFLPQKLVDYVIVHELCHVCELNHSKNFWRLVAEVLPDYKELLSELKRT